MKPSPRLRRVLAIARLTAVWAWHTRNYQTDMNAWRRYEGSLPPVRTSDDEPGEDADDCPF